MNLQAEIDRVFTLQKQNCASLRKTTAKERVQKLQRLQRKIEAETPALNDALYADLRKAPPETGMTEIFPAIAEIKHAVRHLHTWMKPTPVSNPLVFLGADAEIRYQPRGVVLIISPWNFPFQLLMSPLTSAIAAGNCVIVKPSEISSHTSAFIRRLLSETFPENEVAVVEGDQAVSAALLEKPFDHIFFTGSPEVGKIVMQAAAKNLSSVTLELGGKSPVVVDESADLADAANKIIWGKLINSGQACVAPDYLLLPESLVSDFVRHAKAAISRLYGDPHQSADYCRIINTRHHTRVRGLIQDAVQRGATLETGGQDAESEKYIEPTILSRVPPDAPLLQQEIFGPVLPIVTYRTLEEAVAFINARSKPLSLYIFTARDSTKEFILQNTSSGGACINDVVLYFANMNLPFGGVNHSGLGSSHGYYGFRAFSHERAVIRQPKLGPIRFLYPPYTERVKKLVDLTIRFFT